MRKIIVLLVSLLFLYSFATLSFAKNAGGKAAKKAESSIEVIRGKIVSIDTTASTIVIRDKKTGAEKVISVNPKTILSLKTGEEVKVTLKSGTNIAESVKKITKKKHNK
jgi:hypothetical protein